MGAEHAATQPTDADFDGAAVWRVHLPTGADASQDLLLNIHYTGDVARLYLNGKFLDDNFYNGRPFEFGLKRYAPDIDSGELLLKILPLRKDAPIYIQKESLPDFGAADTALALNGIDVIERHEALLGIGA
jgi:beta-galactosidase